MRAAAVPYGVLGLIIQCFLTCLLVWEYVKVKEEKQSIFSLKVKRTSESTFESYTKILYINKFGVCIIAYENKC